MTKPHRRRTIASRVTTKPAKPIVTGAPTRDEVKRLAKFARIMLPRSVVRDLPRARGKCGPSDATILIEGALLVGSAAGKVLGVWSEPSIRAIALVLADATGVEELRRAVGIWHAIERIGPAALARIKVAVSRARAVSPNDGRI